MDKIVNDAGVYTDIQGLGQLRGKLQTDPKAVKAEMAKQFEAIFLQMVMHSMREANAVFSSDLFSGSAMNMYQDMFDKQLTISLSSKGSTGLAKLIEDNIDRQMGVKPTLNTPPTDSTPTPINYTQPMMPTTNPFFSAARVPHHPNEIKPIDADAEAAAAVMIPESDGVKTQHASEPAFNSRRDFLHAIWSEAKRAAATIGVHPTVLLAQAALETDWGKRIIQHVSGNSSHNLFNIKADGNWKNATTTASTLEQKGDILVKEKASFRSYPSFKESFMDYAGLITNNARYKKAVENAHDPTQYSQALQEAGYASDKKYASKIMDIMKSPNFQSIIGELK